MNYQRTLNTETEDEKACFNCARVRHLFGTLKTSELVPGERNGSRQVKLN